MRKASRLNNATTRTLMEIPGSHSMPEFTAPEKIKREGRRGGGGKPGRGVRGGLGNKDRIKKKKSVSCPSKRTQKQYGITQLD
jgi:hypothetical protein